MVGRDYPLQDFNDGLWIHPCQNDDVVMQSLNNLNIILHYGESYSIDEFSNAKELLKQAYIEWENTLMLFDLPSSSLLYMFQLQLYLMFFYLYHMFYNSIGLLLVRKIRRGLDDE